MTRGLVIAISLVFAALAAALIWWFALRGGGGDGGAKNDATASDASGTASGRGVDLEKYRASIRERVEHAKRVAVRQRAARDAVVAKLADAGVGDGGVPAKPRFAGRELMEPQCILGTAELCAILEASITACDEGHGQACLAVGQYLVDNPPRPLITSAFFLYACKSGEEEGCARMRAIKENQVVACEDDAFQCAWVGYKSKDPVRLDEACAHGVADACVWFLDRDDVDPARSRTYLEAACQLGSSLACNELGRRLTPGCQPNEDGPCYAPDPAQAAEARAIACEAGFEEACG
jgi:TPR repeat protein